jgi:hypothetical protein
LTVLAVHLTAMALLTGCIALGGVDRDAATIDKSVGTARNSSILLNIVRASRNEPLYFYSINQVQGSGIEDFKFSLPPITLGPRQTAAQQNYTFGSNGLNVLDSQRSGYFNIAILDSKNFYAGMLAPLDLVAVNILIKQGFSRELIYRLIVDDITFYGPHPVTGQVGLYRFENNPASPTYPLFNGFLKAAMSHGITTEEYYVTNIRSAPGKPQGGPDAMAGGEQGASNETTEARLCADMALVDDPAARTDVDQSHNACGQRPLVLPAEVGGPQQVVGLAQAYAACTAAHAPAAQDNRPTNQVCAVLNGHEYAVQLDTRSLYGIFRYLGAAVAKQSDIELGNLGSPNEPQAAGRLISLVKDRQSNCFATADWHDHYCVPAEDSDNLKQVFSIINALQALKTSPGDLPFTPSVRIEQ